MFSSILANLSYQIPIFAYGPEPTPQPETKIIFLSLFGRYIFWIVGIVLALTIGIILILRGRKK